MLAGPATRFNGEMHARLLCGALLAGALVSRSAIAQPPAVEVQEVAATGSMPKGATLSPDGTRLYVTNFGQRDTKNVTVYDARTLAKLDQLDLPGVICESAISPDGRTLYLSNFSRSSVVFFDLASKQVTHEIKTGQHPKVLVASPDGKSVFAANWMSKSVTQIDVATASVLRTLEVGKQPRGMAMSASGTLYVANFYGDSIDVFEGKDLEKKHEIAVCKCPRHLALSPDDKTLYISCLNFSQLHALDVATETVTHRVQIGDSPKSIAVSRDGRYVYSADYGLSRSVSVVDTSDWTARVFPIASMDRGSGVAVTPDGKHALVTGWYDAHVYLVGFEGTGGHPELTKRKMRGWQFLARHPDPGD
ncbi:MAG: cell surface protein [Labilithrix sp.]|nr:cell surface protein [Labilithrix sp.]